MEDILHTLLKEATGSKYFPLRKACQDTLDLLEDPRIASSTQPYRLREICLQPLQLALESKNSKFATYALGGIQKMVADDRFQSSMENEKEERWLPMQILDSVWNTTFLPEDVQVEVMRTLMNMTFSTSWCMNAKVVTRISELCFQIYVSTTKSSLRYIIVKSLLKMLRSFYARHSQPQTVVKDKDGKVVLETYGANITGSVRTAARATLTQLLSTIAETLKDKQALGEVEANSAIAEFTGGLDGTSQSETTSLSHDVVNILKFLCEKLTVCQRSGQRQTEPLLLEGILSILKNIPTEIRNNEDFVNLVWQEMCPHLVCILGNPLTDKSVATGKSSGGATNQEDVGRGSGCSTNAPNVQFYAAKTIYSIAVELVRLVGCLHSMRPVLESVFHRMLLYPPPVHRLEAIKSLKEILSCPVRLLDLAGPTIADDKEKTSSKKKMYSELDLLKLVVDCLGECCRCNEPPVCLAAVGLVSDLLDSVEQLTRGDALTPQLTRLIHAQCSDDSAADESNSVSAFQLTGMLKPQMRKNENLEASDAEPHQNDSGESDTNDEDDIEKDSRLKTLHDKDEIEMHYRRTSEKVDFESIERQSGQDYVKKLLQLLPSLLQCYSMSEADEMMQQFASQICADSQEDESHSAILNADGVYLATYSVLLLNLKLIRSGYYNSQEKSLPMAEQQFVDEILGTGMLLYLSRAWLSEVFLHVVQTNLLQTAGYDDRHAQDSVLCNLLTDIDGLESRKMGGQLMVGHQEESQINLGEDQTEADQAAVLAGMKFVKRVLIVCWDNILEVLSVLINGKSQCGITGSLSLMINAKEENRKAQEAICGSLSSLQKAARLCCVLGLQDRCGAVFQQLAIASCMMDDGKREPATKTKPGGLPGVLAARPKLTRLHTAHSLSLDLVLSMGLEMGSHAADCWKHVFRCCAHISALEHVYFSRGGNQATLPKVQMEQKQVDLQTENGFDDSDLYPPASLLVPVEPVAPTIDVPALIRQSAAEVGLEQALTGSGGGVLTAEQTSKVLCGLAQEVDSLFENACDKLNMKSLLTFLTELCIASMHQLRTYNPHHDNAAPVNTLHLYRLGDVVLRCLKSGRPLLHTMRIWSIVAPHLVEAACHKDRNISKKAVQCIHEVVTTLLSSLRELPHFHFNESLCKPFENLLCLELCDGDVQDQIVCSICELVEACTSEIKSGWRPLFGALRAVKIEFTTNEEVNEARQRHVAAVLDVFEVFLNTDNTLVFANAAIDCILCLLKYVRGPGEFEEYPDDDSDSGNELAGGGSAAEDLILPALRYLQRCCAILASMWKMPACPVFNGAHRIRTSSKLQVIDSVIPDMDLHAFQKAFHSSQSENVPPPKPSSHIPSQKVQECRASEDADNKSLNSLDSGIGVSAVQSEVSPDKCKQECNKDNEASSAKSPKPIDICIMDCDKTCDKPLIQYKGEHLEALDSKTGVLHVWFLVLDGLAGTVAEGPRNYQPQTLEMLFTLMRSAATVPGARFAVHVVNHLLLPTFQAWLRRGTPADWDAAAVANFKHCSGLCADLVVEYIIAFAGESGAVQAAVEFMLQQLLDLLIECIAQPIESLSRLGCSCIRHNLLSCGPIFTENMWQVVATSLHRAFDVTLHCLRTLMTPFQADSDNFYGDIGQVKVAVRRDCTTAECFRLRQLAQQVFLLDSQRGGGAGGLDTDLEESHSYTFLVFPPAHHEADAGVEQPLARVSFRSLVVSLLSHQLLVGTVGSLLLQGAGSATDAERAMMPGTGDDSAAAGDAADSLLRDSPLPGLLRYMSSRNVLAFLCSLQHSVATAEEFDSRPGLKFLIQKVVKSDVAANMYKQAGLSLTFYVHTLLEICAHQNNISKQNTKDMLWGKQDLESEDEYEDASSDFDSAHVLPPVKAAKQDPLSTENLSKTVETATFAAYRSIEELQKFTIVFIHKLKQIFDDICTKYVDLYLEKEGPNAADQLSTQLLVFLVAPDELPSLKREKSLKEMVEEKLEERRKQEQENAGIVNASVSVVDTTAEPVQGCEDEDTETPPTNTHSPHGSPAKTAPPKHDAKDKVYNVATNKTINNLMSDYKKRKQMHTMPTFVKQTRSKPVVVRKPITATDPIDRQIEQQQRDSIMKDSEAHLLSYIEVICGLLHLYHQLPDAEYTALLPVIFNFLNQLTCHCRHRHLRLALATWTFRLGTMFDLNAPGDKMPSNPRD